MKYGWPWELHFPSQTESTAELKAAFHHRYQKAERVILRVA